MIEKSEIYKWWDVFRHGHDLTEIRIICGGRTYSGYFKNVENLINAITPFDAQKDAQIYFTLNSISEACYGRAQHEKIIPIKREPTTSDVDIDGRTHVLIDLDPRRPAGVSSSDAELEAAHRKAVDIYRWLLSQGFNEPIVCMSGNGYHIVIPCQIMVNDERTELIKRFLQTMSLLFSDDDVEVDEKVFNAARICKLYGVTAKKGDNIPERPWRQSAIIKVPDEIKTTDIAYFRKVADMYPEEEVKPDRYNGYSHERFDLTGFLHRHNIQYKEKRINGGTKYVLEHCPFNDQHKAPDSAIFQRDNGAIGFICLHNTCSHRKWQDVRTFFEPDAYDHKYQPTPQIYKSIVPSVPQPIIPSDDKGDVWLRMSSVKKPTIDLADYIPSGIPAIDSKGLGFRRGHVSVWTGYRGCGKSSLLNQLILNAAQFGFKSALWTGELTPDMEKQWLYLQAAGKQYTVRYRDTDYYYVPDMIAEHIDPWMDRHLRVFNNRYGDNFLQIKEQLRQLKKESDFDVAIFDNLMVLDIRQLDEQKYDRQGRLLQDLEDIAKELNIHIHLVAHPHKAFGYLRVDNISGSGDISNKADNVFIVSRINQDFRNTAEEFLGKMQFDEIIESGCTNIVEIGKFRNKGTIVGTIAKLWFEEETNRLKNYIAESTAYAWTEQGRQQQLPIREPEPVPSYVREGLPFAPPDYSEPSF